MAFARSRLLGKVSPVPTRDVVPASSLVYHPRYAPARKVSLSKAFDTVNEKNRFLSLEILLERLSGHVGRRQYKMQSDLTRYADRLRELGVDWHDVKLLSSHELRHLLRDQLQLSHAERAVLLPAVDVKLCGVLRPSSTRHSNTLCMNPGRAEHGWRCGLHGHTNDVYFEGKQRANPVALRLAHRSSIREASREGIDITVRSEPNFSVVGRRQEELNPRVWSTPENLNFHVTQLGFEFRVHPEDPRAARQIEAAAAEWELHGQVVQQVISEMLELYAVERAPQPLDMRPGEVGPPDVPQSYSGAFTSRVARREGGSTVDAAAATAANADDSDSDGVVVEQRMVDTKGNERPWFQRPLDQQFTDDGVPSILPFAPSLVVKTSYRQVERLGIGDDAATSQLTQPVLDVAVYVHPEACFWWNAENEERCIKHILDYAKRVPYPLPFNLYYRVDSAKELRLHPKLIEEQENLSKSKAMWFDLRHFRTVYGAASQEQDLGS